MFRFVSALYQSCEPRLRVYMDPTEIFITGCNVCIYIYIYVYVYLSICIESYMVYVYMYRCAHAFVYVLCTRTAVNKGHKLE